MLPESLKIKIIKNVCVEKWCNHLHPKIIINYEFKIEIRKSKLMISTWFLFLFLFRIFCWFNPLLHWKTLLAKRLGCLFSLALQSCFFIALSILFIVPSFKLIFAFSANLAPIWEVFRNTKLKEVLF